MSNPDPQDHPPSEREHLKVTVYSPDSYARRPHELVAGMIRDFSASRGLAWRMFLRNVRAQYRQSALGYLWIFLPPLVTTLVWVFLNKSKILSVGETAVPYPAYVLTGNLMWQGFIRALVMPIQTITKEKATLTKLNYPREALVTAGFGEALFNALVPLLLLLPVFLWYRIPFSANQLMAPVGFVILILFGYSLGLLAAPIGLLFTDVQRGIPLVCRFWFFLTPIVYPVPTEFPASLVATINPVTPLITTARDWFTGQSPQMLAPFWWLCVATLFLFFVGLLLFRLAMPHIVERMSA